MVGSFTQAGPLPSYARLGDVARIFNGSGVSREEAIERSGKKLPVIGVRDMDDGRVAPCAALDRIGFEDVARAENYAVYLGDVLLTGRGTILKFGLVGPETAGAVASANIIIVRPSAAVVGGALYAILSSDVFRPKIELLRRGSTTLLSLSPKDLAKLELDIPPLDEQRRIAAFVLEAQSAYRTSLEAAELRRSLARALINERLFGHN